MDPLTSYQISLIHLPPVTPVRPLWMITHAVCWSLWRVQVLTSHATTIYAGKEPPLTIYVKAHTPSTDRWGWLLCWRWVSVHRAMHEGMIYKRMVHWTIFW